MSEKDKRAARQVTAYLLRRYSHKKMSAIAEKLGVSIPAVSGMLKRQERVDVPKGLEERIHAE